MNDYKNISWIIFDSGYVLNYPTSGQWFYPLKFYEYCKYHNLNLNKEKLELNFINAYKNLFINHKILSENEEYLLFINFYRILLKDIISYEYIDELIDLSATETVFNDNKFTFYDDVFENIVLLNQKFNLCILSDSWPSLIRVYKNKSLFNYFKLFLISSFYNLTKESKLFFKLMLEKINEKPDNLLFIDDNDNNLLKAKECGINVIKMNRKNKNIKNNSRFIEINSLNELKEILL
jgi:putative hydrolase of the HAD superfamily